MNQVPNKNLLQADMASPGNKKIKHLPPSLPPLPSSTTAIKNNMNSTQTQKTEEE